MIVVRWKEADVNARLESFIGSAHEILRSTMRRDACDMRTAAVVVAERRVNEAMELRGLG